MRTRRLPLLVTTLVAPAALTLALSGCSSSDSGPDPQPVATGLAQGLASGDLSQVAFVGTTPDAVQKQYDAAVAGLGGVKPNVTVAGVSESGDSKATATLHWTWPLGDGWSYTTQAPLRTTSDGNQWQIAWRDDVVEPSLTGGDTLAATTVAAKRGDILGPHGVGLVTERPVVRFGVDRLKVGAAQAPDSARRLAQLVGIDVAPYVKQVKDAGPKAFVQAIVYRQEEVPPAVTSGYTAHQGRRRDRGLPASGDHQGVRGPDPRHGRPGHGRDDQGPPRRLPGRRRRGAVRPRGAVRRAAARQVRGPGGCRRLDREADQALRDQAGERPAGTADHRAPAAAAGRADPRRTSGRPARSSRSGRRPARSSRPPTGPATTATTTPPTDASRRARRSRPWARWRWSSRGRPRRHRWTARRA